MLKRQVLKQYGENYYFGGAEGGVGDSQTKIPAWNFWSNLSLTFQIPKQWPLFIHSSKDLMASEGTFRIRLQLILSTAEIHPHE